MNCEPYAPLLDQRLTGGLGEQDRAALEAHLASCPSCRMRLMVLEDCRAMSEADEVPASFASSWREAARKEADTAQAAPPMRTRWMAMAAALLIMIGGAWQARINPVGPAGKQTEAVMLDRAMRSAPMADMEAAPLEENAMLAESPPAPLAEAEAAPETTTQKPAPGPMILMGLGLVTLILTTITMIKRRKKK